MVNGDERSPWVTVVIAATGPSFDQEQADQIEAATDRCAVIAVNDAYMRLPHARILYACDGSWWKVHDGARDFSGERWTQDVKAAQTYGLRLIASNPKGSGLCVERMKIHHGANSGFQAMNLAYHFGARTMILVGFDCQKTGGKKHYFGDHPHPLSQTHSYAIWQRHFGMIAADLAADGVDVVNASKETALTCFRRASLAEALA